ncbi:DUF2207 domain-containing protein [Kosmotoga pacifica]|uniref:DUF2207 domain-containing protein n=1 Tax=Kosmotoga pacifica TaxID=1330330 RepID=A0A0G2ZBB4_9BACT|nr:DUF2207 domain-containing protein [Kosmotoga pacifica]AKI96859.1 hypothetical protein IX53_02395 [Kosmotoga pacifica]
MKKLIIRGVITAAVSLAIWIIISLVVGGTGFNSTYHLESVEIEHRIMDDGTMEVHEKINYLLVKPYRGIYREIPTGRTKYSDIKVWTEGMNYTKIQNFSTANSLKLKVWLVPFNGSPREPSEGGDRVTLHITYKVQEAVEEGYDVAQLFWKYWGEDWEQPVKNLKASFSFPDYVNPIKIYTHPPADIKRESNTYWLQWKKFPAKTFGEVRMVLPKGVFTVSDSGRYTLEDIEKIENDYSRKVMLWKVNLPLILLGSSILILFLLFYFMGREPRIDYNALYERELPTNDGPEFINAVVKNLCTGVDNDGLGACILNLYRKGYLDFNVDSKKGRIEGIILKKLSGGDLSSAELQLLQFFSRYAIDFGDRKIFDFSELKSRFRKNQKEARRFTQELRTWKSFIKAMIKERKYLLSTGAGLSKLYALFLMAFSLFALFNVANSYEINFLFPVARYVYGLFWGVGAVVLTLPVDVFGRWTKKGREYYLKWKNFENYLKDYSLLSEYPPSSVVLWEEYLVYATALGVADEVRKHMNKIVPQELWEKEGGHMYMYYPYGLHVSRDFGSVVSTASAASSSSSSGSGAGGVGGGSGGGGGGAF